MHPSISTRPRWDKLLLAALLALTTVLAGLVVASPAQALDGASRIHDPSVIKVGSCYYAFSTGFENDPSNPSGAPTTHRSCTSAQGPWTKINNTWDTNPAWLDSTLPNRFRNIWGPDINYWNGTYFLYYSAAEFSPTARAVTGLATSTSITGPWTDQGIVTDVNFPIDPDIVQAQDGTRYISWGSFAGAYMHAIDSSTGKLSTTNRTLSYLTYNTEGQTITYNNGYYYLLASRDRCCQGVYSKYWTVAGRSRTITGPYVDANGVALTDPSGTAGTTVLTGAYPKVAAGGGDIYFDGTTPLYAYHYYDGRNNGIESLDIRRMTWSASGWPLFDAPLGQTQGFVLQNANSEKCADVWGLSAAERAPVNQGDCNNGANQKWNVVSVGSNVQLVNVNSGKCLEIYGNNTTAGTAATQFTCNGGNNQLWTRTPTIGGYFTLRNVNSGQCLEVYGNNTATGAALNQWSCNGGRNQQWQLN